MWEARRLCITITQMYQLSHVGAFLDPTSRPPPRFVFPTHNPDSLDLPTTCSGRNTPLRRLQPLRAACHCISGEKPLSRCVRQRMVTIPSSIRITCANTIIPTGPANERGLRRWMVWAAGLQLRKYLSLLFPYAPDRRRGSSHSGLLLESQPGQAAASQSRCN